EEILMEAPKVTIRGQNGEVVYENGIVSRTTASHTQHAGNHSMTGPASAAASPPGMPASAAKTIETFALAGRSGKALESVPYEIKDAQGQAQGSGGTDGSGATSSLSGKLVETLSMIVKRN
ncbi:MAG: type VI secretion system tip protein VgrG, partial [Proteobacteria bacterium]|nr:type VI secretion system tip protein VgrG [Pseudomonadota bacterium]